MAITPSEVVSNSKLFDTNIRAAIDGAKSGDEKSMELLKFSVLLWLNTCPAEHMKDFYIQVGEHIADWNNKMRDKMKQRN